MIAAAADIRIAKGKKLDAFTDRDDATRIVSGMLGSTGNLRAPTIVVGSTLAVGFNEEVYREVFDVG